MSVSGQQETFHSSWVCMPLMKHFRAVRVFDVSQSSSLVMPVSDLNLTLRLIYTKTNTSAGLRHDYDYYFDYASSCSIYVSTGTRPDFLT